jgi:hypothetical protein
VAMVQAVTQGPEAWGLQLQQRRSFHRALCARLQEKKRRQQRVRLDKVTNTHMPELFLGTAPQNIDER